MYLPKYIIYVDIRRYTFAYENMLHSPRTEFITQNVYRTDRQTQTEFIHIYLSIVDGIYTYPKYIFVCYTASDKHNQLHISTMF